MNKTNRNKAVEKFIKHNHKFHLRNLPNEQKGNMRYGVFNNNYLTDGCCVVKTSEDLSEHLQSKNDSEHILNTLNTALNERKRNDNIGNTYMIDINKLINDAKSNGFKDTFKQQQEENSNFRKSHVIHLNGSCFYFRLLHKAFQCINDGEISMITEVKRPYGTEGKYSKSLYLQTGIGECFLLNFYRPDNMEISLEDDFNHVYNLLDYVIK